MGREKPAASWSEVSLLPSGPLSFQATPPSVPRISLSLSLGPSLLRVFGLFTRYRALPVQALSQPRLGRDPGSFPVAAAVHCTEYVCRCPPRPSTVFLSEDGGRAGDPPLQREGRPSASLGQEGVGGKAEPEKGRQEPL